MKLKTAFHLLVATLIAFGAASCGSDNAANSGSVDSTVTTTTTTTISSDLLAIMQANPGSGASTKAELLAAIADHQFDYASPAGIHYFVDYSGSSSSNCKTKWGLFTYCTGSSSNSEVYFRRLNSDGTIDKNFNGSSYGSGEFGNSGYYSNNNYAVENIYAEADSNFGADIRSLNIWLYQLVENSVVGDTLVEDSTSRQSYSNNAYKGFRIEDGGYYYYIDLRLPLIVNPYAVRLVDDVPSGKYIDYTK